MTHYQFNGNLVKYYSWEELIEDWLFLLLIKFLKKENLYAKACEIYFTPLKEGKYTCLMEAHSCNYIPDKMIFGTLSCTFTDWEDSEIFANFDELNRYERKWSQFIYIHKYIIPEEAFGEDFDEWFIKHYRYAYPSKDLDFVERISKECMENG